jgi:lipopolysaccharide/colanic/teichoic acid biosynthesis glycosyltransferase
MNVLAEDILVAQVALPTRPNDRSLSRGRGWILAAVDLLALCCAYVAARVIVDHAGPPFRLATASFLLVALSAGPAWLAVLAAYRLYDHDRRAIAAASVDEARALFHALLTGSFAFLALAQVVPALHVWLPSPLEAGFFVVGAVGLIAAGRSLLRTFVFPRVMRPRRTLIVGSGRAALAAHDRLAGRRGVDVVGFLRNPGDRSQLPDPVLGTEADLAWIVDELEVDVVLLAGAATDRDRALALLAGTSRGDVQVAVVPAPLELAAVHGTRSDFGGLPIVSLRRPVLGAPERLLKRSLDVALASAALLLTAPLIAAAAAAVRLESGGPVFVRRPRRGRGGSIYRLLSFRTIDLGSSAGPAAPGLPSPLLAVRRGGPDTTRVGAFLIRTRIESLPRLWNVLRGDLSFVGVEPVVLCDAGRIAACGREELKPGLTRPARLAEPAALDDRVTPDSLYATGWSAGRDLALIARAAVGRGS